MSETVSNPDQKTTDIESALDAINKNVDQKMDQKFKAFDESLDAKLDKFSSKKFDDDSQDLQDNDDEGEFVTKKDLKRLTKELAESIKKDTISIADKSFESKMTKIIKDEEANRDFPMLNKQSPEYNEDFYRDVEGELKARMRNGYRGEDPHLIYDAAAVVEKKWINSGRYLPKSAAERINQAQNNRTDSFIVRGKSNPGDGPTATQIALAEQFGMSKEKLMQRMRKTR